MAMFHMKGKREGAFVLVYSEVSPDHVQLVGVGGLVNEAAICPGPLVGLCMQLPGG